MTVSVALVAAVLGASMLVEQVRGRRVVEEARAKRTLQLAEATVDQAAVLLSAGTLNENGSIDWSGDAADNDGDGRVDEGDEQVRATLSSWHTDGVDNDGDGKTDEDDEAVVRVTSTATVGSVARRVTGWLQRSAATLPSPEAAVYVNDPLATTQFQGNAFQVDGTDRNLNGTAGPEPARYGIAINGSPLQVINQLSPVQLDNVKGKGGFPSVTNWAPPDPDLIDDVIAAFTSRASIVFNHYSGVYTGNLGNSQINQYVVTKSNGDLKIGGGSTGAGILLVEGNLEISGNWEYVGFVFVTGKVTMQGGGGTKRLRGTMFVDGDVIQSSTVLLWINGTVDLLYSSQALDLVRNAFGTYSVNAIVEG
ncbi:MAG TPA: hypothetical protein VFI25_16265 [Planctomycetota bacterium]|jgi:hypothetical protein|nr:hypothetical protein [Planctomycetota bacterium]